jgi:hypothetical protein
MVNRILEADSIAASVTNPVSVVGGGSGGGGCSNGGGGGICSNNIDIGVSGNKIVISSNTPVRCGQ